MIHENADHLGHHLAHGVAPSRTWSRFTALFQVAPPWTSWLRSTYSRENSETRNLVSE
jgi:hypothetical protein